MSHTYSANLIHCVFSTKERKPTIPTDQQGKLWAYLIGIGKNEGVDLLATGGTENHVHLLLSLPPTRMLSEVVQKLKGNSSHWMGTGFCWQQGYGAFSVSPSQVAVVKEYIRNQAEHHRKQSFEDEFISLLNKCGIEYDPQFVFG
ncbi:MAG TPA: IS200/IS605 family transposase [Terriglobales bacterium]|jgi:REP element-mobilizing transposase RayT|nr:IS200/IS605 family transposase [Terriglobales bacterium]